MSSGKDTILVVDDRPANRYATVHALRRSGFKVIEAESGREALELAQQAPAAILLDVKLPDILGYEVCRRIKSNPRTSHIPVLQLSAAFADNESRVYALGEWSRCLPDAARRAKRSCGHRPVSGQAA